MGRSVWKGPFVDGYLLKKAEKSRGTGRNDHHLAEAAFKALGRALRVACEPDPRRPGVPSTKGSLG